MSRPTWDEFFLSLARHWATMATCSRRKVGAVVVKDRKVIGNGFNGVASGKLHCTEGGCPRGQHYYCYDQGPNPFGCACGSDWPCESAAEPGSDYNQFPCHAIHAEHNAILQAGIGACRGATLYVTDQPCQQCSNLIEHAKIGGVVIRGQEEEGRA